MLKSLVRLKSGRWQKAKAPSKTVLLTEKKLREMGLPENGSFKIEKGMIVTALARDYLKRQKIEIIE